MKARATHAWSRYLSVTVRAAISLALLAWLIFSVEWHAIGRAIIGASPLVITASCLLYYLGIGLSCWKWRLLLDLEQIPTQMNRLFRWYLISAFASNFLPTDIGGDLGRAYLAGRYTGQPLAIIRSILIERLSGLVVMVVLAVFGVALLMGQPVLAILLFGLGLCIAALASLVMYRAPRHPLLAKLLARLPQRVRDVLVNTMDTAPRYLRQPGSMILTGLLSIAFQTLAGTGAWLNLWATGAYLPLWPVILAAAIAGVAGLLPITLNGWGVREGLLVTLLTPFGAAPGPILAGALLGRGLTLIATLPGGVLLLREHLSDLPSSTS